MLGHQEAVDGTLIEAWASLKSFRPKDTPPPDGGSGRKPEVDFHGERRLNQTHASTKDPEARLFRKGKGKEANFCFMGHVLMENRHGLIISLLVNAKHLRILPGYASLSTIFPEAAILFIMTAWGH